MCPEFSYSKGRIPATVEFITKEMEDFDKYFADITQCFLLQSLQFKGIGLSIVIRISNGRQ